MKFELTAYAALQQVLKLEVTQLPRLLRISWADRKSNEWVLGKIDCKETLLATLFRRKVSFVGYILRGKDVSCELFVGSVYRNRCRGKPKMRYSENIDGRVYVRNMVDIY